MDSGSRVVLLLLGVAAGAVVGSIRRRLDRREGYRRRPTWRTEVLHLLIAVAVVALGAFLTQQR